jgi:hypothetical protein
MHATSKSRVLGAVPLSKWLFIYTSRSGRQAEDFIRQISAVRIRPSRAFVGAH